MEDRQQKQRPKRGGKERRKVVHEGSKDVEGRVCYHLG